MGLRITAIIIGLLLTLSPAARAQAPGRVAGRVLDQTGSVLPGVTIDLVVNATEMTATTDAQGQYRFDAVPSGSAELTYRLLNFGVLRRTVNVTNGASLVQDVVLTLSLNADVVVTGTSTFRNIADVDNPAENFVGIASAASQGAITAAQLERLPVSQRTGLPDAIVTAAPGMIRGHDDFVHVRGEEVALNPLINGVAFWENPHAVFSSGLSPDVIDTANVMTGGFPAEYGTRFGGVVDIVTKSGLRMANSGSATINGGEAGRFNLLGDFGGHRDRFGYYAFGSMFESDRFLSPPDPQAIHDHARGGTGCSNSTAILARRDCSGRW